MAFRTFATAVAGASLLALSLAACSKSESRTADTARKGSPRAPGGAVGGAAPTGPSTEGAMELPRGPDASFRFMASAPPEVTAGGESVAQVMVHPGPGYKMNKEYPTKLTLEPPAGISLAKAVLEPGDAQTFTDKELTFAVKFTPAGPGDYTIGGVLKFAVCTDSTCDPKKQRVALVVKAQ